MSVDSETGAARDTSSGAPLSGVRIVEFAGIGPGPFCGMLLSDLGADIIRIDRGGDKSPYYSAARFDVTGRGRRSIQLNLKQTAAVETSLELVERADAIIEGFRPGVMERLGLGPNVLLQRNPKLVYVRITGWGQYGPLAHTAGHDLNYIAISGALAAIGSEGQPMPPLNLVGDYGGGALYAAMGLLAAIIHARATGHGQVVDCAMSDGAASLMSVFYGMRADGSWHLERRANLLDGGAHYYDTYMCKDGKWVAIAATEPQFYAKLRALADLNAPEFDTQLDRTAWPHLKAKVAAAFATKTRDEWCAIMEGADVCFAPVLDLDEAPDHPHNRARQVFIDVGGVRQPAPAPRFSLTPGAVTRPPPEIGQGGNEALLDWGVSPAKAAGL